MTTTRYDMLLGQTRVLLCLDCGKCTAVCPVAALDGGFSPRRMVTEAIGAGRDQMARSPLLWQCLTCGSCSLRCPSDVRLPEFVRGARREAFAIAVTGTCAHGAVMEAWARSQAERGPGGDGRGWVPEGAEVSEKGEYLYFVGCLPFYEVYFRSLEIHPLEGARGTLALLAALGIRPALLPGEVCCGHDLLWAGDEEGFRRLAERNAEAIRAGGATTIVASCAECARTLREDYPRWVPGFSPRVVHVAELLAEKVAAGSRLPWGGGPAVGVTYQDPCRLAKHLGVVEEPRRALEASGLADLREMPRSRLRAACCGTALWRDCSAVSKALQVERLREAHSTGSEVLLTACPKCQIHLRCAQRESGADPSVQIRLQDLAAFLADRLIPGHGGSGEEGRETR